MKQLLTGLTILGAAIALTSPLSAAPIKMKITTPSVEADAMTQGYIQFAKLVNSRSGGRIEAKVYHSGQLGSHRDSLEGLQLGTIQAAEINTAVVSAVAEEFEIFSLPYVIRSLDHVQAVLYNGVEAKLDKILREKAGLTILSFYHRAARSVYSAKGAINKPEDFEGLKIRVMQSPAMVKTMEILGARPTPIAATERYMALQTGVVDAAENSPALVITEKEYEVTKYLSMTEHFFSPNVFVTSVKFFDSLPKDLQVILKQAAIEGGAYALGNELAQVDNAITALKGVGMKVNFIEDKRPFVEKVKPLYKEYEGKIGKDLIDAFIR
jgi:tripartite ATP-independent transporter DctP family solute receptor